MYESGVNVNFEKIVKSMIKLIWMSSLYVSKVDAV